MVLSSEYDDVQVGIDRVKVWEHLTGIQQNVVDKGNNIITTISWFIDYFTTIAM